MTYSSPPPGPYGKGPDFASPVQRPRVVTTLAIIGIVEAILWMMCSVGGLLMNAASMAAGHNIFMPSVPNMPKPIMVVGAIESIIWLILAIVLLVASIAALSLKAWARRMLVPWSVVMILFFAAQFTLQAVWIGPQETAITKAVQPNNAALVHPLLLLCGGVGLLIVLCILPICFLTLWRSEAVIAAFESRQTDFS